jgi:kumamolisin
MVVRTGRVSALRLGVALPLLAVTILLFSATASATLGPSNPNPLRDSMGAILPAESFAERAGFNSSLDAEVTGASPAAAPMTVVISFEPSSPSLYIAPSPTAPPMTVAEIANEWGLTPGAYAAAESYFEGEGLHVLHAWPDRLTLTLQGSASRFDQAFETKLLSGEYSGRSVLYPATSPALPAWLESQVAGVVGLSNGFTSFELPLLPASPRTDSQPAQSSGNLVTPAIARKIYQISSLYNYTGSATYSTGENIVLLLWGDGYAPSDLSTFYSNDYPSSFPAVTITPYPIDGAPAPSASAVNDPSGAPQELTLDLEWSGSMAPGASLDPVYAPDGPSSDQYSPTTASMTDAMTKAVTGIPGVDAISMSFGTAEGSGGGLASAWATDIAEANQRHITLLGATGDFGGDADANCMGGTQPNFPAADPYVIAVGGTNPTLATNALGQVTGIQSESAWSDSGGGFSTEYPAPSWQLVGSAKAPISASGFRGMPDVSAAAATDYLYYDGADRTGAGTSFATPLWAGLVAEMDALHGASLGFITPNLYTIGATEPAGHLPDALVDIKMGANCLGPAGPGWDTATGWGSPRGTALYADLTATLVNLTLAVSPAPVGPGDSLTLTVQVDNSSSGAPLSGLPVLVSLTSDTTLGVCQGVFGSSTTPTNSSGMVVVSIGVPACYLGSRAVASAQVTADGKYGAAQLIVPVNLLGYLSFLGPIAQYPGDIALYVLIMGAAIALGIVLGRTPRRSVPPEPEATGPAAPPTDAPVPAPSDPPPDFPPPTEAPTGVIVEPPPGPEPTPTSPAPGSP